MNRKQAIKQRILSELEKQDVLSDPRNNMMSFTSGIRLAKKIVSEIEVDQQPISLTDLLGWEEEVEYKVNNNIMKISNNGLEIYDDEEEWFDLFDGYWTNDNIIKLRNAKKAEPKRYYAKIKGTNIYINHIDYIWGSFTTLENRAINMPKTEWNELGINDTNADFEEVD
ncbi:hypothetical protein [Helcococcus kunzii]|uniref:hypothetical protein n=1 Tax=Helcococcus kunzii TaxID=40091 RepID=UPI0038A2CF52